ncbi:hypothetical protein CA51_29190 [Rosistilla oblonga]|uniref:hypothetical protein n=1 Tax=Rosistilla oblonga TaxID=2527990 RepID=UPI00118B5A42|nr:hypothetical protein [Rosistilla oblonga]QDV13033.1 hypothetical protein CA51_29190 [Rosistilla oblonga]
MKPKTKHPQHEALVRRNRRILGTVLVICVIGYTVFVAQKMLQLAGSSEGAMPTHQTAHVSYAEAALATENQNQDLWKAASDIDRKISEKVKKKHVKPRETQGAVEARAAWHKRTEQLETELEQFTEFPEGSVQDQLRKEVEAYYEDKPSI